jgi:hypothetical protein
MIQWVLEDSRRCWEIPGDTVGFQRLLDDSKGYWMIQEDTKG